MSAPITTTGPTGAVTAEARRMADAACAAAGIRVEHAHDADSCRRVAEVLSTIWRRDGSPMIDPALLVAMAHAGNLVTLAIGEDGPVGAAVGFCGPPGAPFHSHVVGLLPGVVGRGLGRAVKLAQRAWCLERGIDAMTWTYDPLVARNAFFNIRRLGAHAAEYLPDFYGEMKDSVNAGQGSDRVLVRWDLTLTPPEPGATRDAGPPAGAQAVVVDADGAPSPFVPPLDRTLPATVAVPRDIEALRRTDPELARRWRAQTRAALTELMGAGWSVTDFTRAGQYVLRAPLREDPAR
ncbi:hypothetical protein [Microbacterium album]|uniref:GNAT family N-acetyltransferase n=1 Tax=Microbacterium album TaxID=2053191 RepID=A0A917MM61_9MICO|nr:hypothetical protein [Microbacterium album]GGH45170.1 hypothetical protein GCM10010921_20370 [Microbacterium album]